MLGLLGVGAADAVNNPDVVSIDTSSINGTFGNLDFTFAGGFPTPPLGTLTVYNFASNGTFGAGELTGNASGSLVSQVALDNNGFPPSDYFTSFTYGSGLTFMFEFSGLAVTAPDGVSGSSTFAFSMLNSSMNPLLTSNAPENPGGFAFTADLNNDGTTTVDNFMATGTVAVAPGPKLDCTGSVRRCDSLGIQTAAQAQHVAHVNRSLLFPGPGLRPGPFFWCAGQSGSQHTEALINFLKIV